jgi:hypothetical protein
LLLLKMDFSDDCFARIVADGLGTALFPAAEMGSGIMGGKLVGVNIALTGSPIH